MALLTKMSQTAMVPNRCVFSNCLNSLRLSHCHSLEGHGLPLAAFKHSWFKKSLSA